jgi:hypothetical protein
VTGGDAAQADVKSKHDYLVIGPSPVAANGWNPEAGFGSKLELIKRVLWRNRNLSKTPN